ncbi:MAG: ImmA/IrrE family metallo-endopeptidase [Deltaproteobacteria bacterium]|nr:ImmA/IrrE family metallo-endopeptidase [Deltaproteobacteria bacterium]
MAERAYITAKVFKWARESAKITEDAAASNVAVSVDRFKEWETGESYPTIKQAQKLAKVYKRPFAVLFLPEIPNDFHPLQDFRKKGSKELSTSSIFIIREIQQKQAWISELNEDDEENAAQFVGRFSFNDSPVKVARDILNTLEINPLDYKTNNPLLEWIHRAEKKGIFISRAGSIHSKLKLVVDEIQGFAIADKYAPFVFINSRDWKSPQLFTLVHELAHLWIAETGVSNKIEASIKSSKDYHPIESFCNEVAANALILEEFITSFEDNIFDNAKDIFKKAKSIGVSSFALLVRALNLNVISLSVYKKLKEQADYEYNEFIKREEKKKAKQKEQKKDTPLYYPLIVNRNGILFIQTALDAYRAGFIDPAYASSLLSVKVNNFSKLEKQIYKWI